MNLADIYSWIDSRKRIGADTLSSLASDPSGTLQRMFAQTPDGAADQRLAQYNGGLLGSVMPDVRQQGFQGLMNQTIPQAMNVAVNANPISGLLGQTVYHGSPHLFDAFDAAKIGTGEGAQAYGHGLYFADNPATATYYANSLGSALTKAHDIASKVLGQPISDNAAYSLVGTANLPQGAKVAGWQSRELRQFPIDKLQEALTAIKETPNSTVYKVDIPDDAIGKMLHWDLPLSQQPQAVQQALGNAPFETRGVGDATGANLYDMAQSYAGGGGVGAKNPAGGASLLQSLGIPGIRYLDGGSRSAGTGTYNTVLFDPSLANIVGRE